MKAVLPVLALAAISYIDSAHSVETGSFTNPCPAHDQTYVCGEAWTFITGPETAFYGRIDVAAYFSGPGYQESRGAFRTFFVNTSTAFEQVYVDMLGVHCMHSGFHSAESIHEAVGRPGWATYRDERFSGYVQHYCDCQSEID
jgi:hypothetical protein